MNIGFHNTLPHQYTECDMSILSTRNSSELLLPLTHGLFLLRRNLKNKKNMDRGETRPKPQHVILLWGASVGQEGQRRIMGD